MALFIAISEEFYLEGQAGFNPRRFQGWQERGWASLLGEEKDEGAFSEG
jgi:hypothetical protein